MEKFILLVIPLVFTLSFSSNSIMTGKKHETLSKEISNVQEVTTYYFIRHAEKDISNPSNKDPELTQQGEARAENWSKVFKEVLFDVIYSTNYNRTRSTAQKIAASQDKEVQYYDASKMNDTDFQSKTKGKTVLIVGHSNTNPAFVNQILKQKKYSDIDEKESGSLFIVTVFPDGTKTSQILYIN